MIDQVVNKNIRLKTSTLRSDLCDYSNAYIVVKGAIIVQGDNDDKTRNKKLTFNNYALFRSCRSKIKSTYRDNAEDLDIVMLIYNLLEYSGSYSVTSGSLCNFYRNEINDSAIENNDYGNNTNNNKTVAGKSFNIRQK